jgi:hypothetical protein
LHFSTNFGIILQAQNGWEEILVERIHMVDLNFPNAIYDEEDLFGREEVVREIENNFLHKKRTPVLLVGERRIGKTSVQNVIMKRLQTQINPQYIQLAIEPRGMSTFNAFSQAILLRLIAFQQKKHPAAIKEQLQLPFNIQNIEEFEFLFSQNVHDLTDQVFVITVDEFDEIVRQAVNLGDELSKIMGLIYYLVEKADLPITFFFTMTKIPEVMRTEVPSTLASMSQIKELGPLRQIQMEKMVKSICGESIGWDSESIQSLFHLSGGHPYFTKLILAHLALMDGDRQPGNVNIQMIEQARKDALNDPQTGHVVENLYRVHFLEAEKEIVLLLSQRHAPVSIEELISVGTSWATVTRRLVKRCYLVEKEGKFDFKIAFLGDWIRDWVEYEQECEQYGQDLRAFTSSKDIEIDEAAGEVRFLRKPMEFSPKETDILRYLAARVDQLVSREDLADAIWGTFDGTTNSAIDTNIYRIRKKIGSQYIETRPGQGFVLHRAILISRED